MSARPLAERFWSKVDRSGGPDACWPWLAGLNHYGYPHFRVGDTIVRGNRLAIVLGDPEDVERPGGRIPPRPLAAGEVSRHGRQCHESGVGKRCTNPAHLTPGNQSDNLYDCYDYGEREREFSGVPRWLKEPKALSVPGQRRSA